MSVNSSPLNDPIRLSLSGVISASSAAALRSKEDDLAGAIEAGRSQLKVHDDRYIMATVEAFLWDFAKVPGLRAAEFSLDLLADEGTWLSTALNSVSITTNNSDTATNAGNTSSPPTITITAPGGGLTAAILTNATTEKTLTWSGSIAAGADLSVDMDEMTISEAGVESAAGFATGSVFWDLAAGSNTVTISSTPTGASALIEWRDRWL